MFRIKKDSHGKIVRYKARLVAKGYKQIEGIDYTGTWAPVLLFTSMRMLLKIAVEKGLQIHQMDVKTAFLNGNLDREIYMDQPEDFVVGNIGMKCKLRTSIYGLKFTFICCDCFPA